MPCRLFATPVSARAVHGSSDRLAVIRGLATTLGFEETLGLATTVGFEAIPWFSGKPENIRMLLTDR
ncbi:MAG: hypothetical protein IIA50_02545 [Bacteroidetes bacterium]|nr:hypothetical protein [Bacteroidota bacterium]